MIVLLFGAPGSGKGTQSRFISERRKIPTISTGDMLRAECRDETVVGLAAKSVLAKGGLVEDELVNAMVVHRITEPDCRGGFILDGYPRTVPQAVFLSQFLKDSALPSPTVMHLDVPIPVKRIITAHSHKPEKAGTKTGVVLPYRTPSTETT